MNSSPWRIFIVIVSIFTVTACLTAPGHRQIISEGDFYLHIAAPSKAIKESIRFTPELNKIEYLPVNTKIKLSVQEQQNNHELTITNKNGSVVYYYRLNGKAIDFGEKEQRWFSSHIPKIVEKTAW